MSKFWDGFEKAAMTAELAGGQAVAQAGKGLLRKAVGYVGEIPGRLAAHMKYAPHEAAEAVGAGVGAVKKKVSETAKAVSNKSKKGYEEAERKYLGMSRKQYNDFTAEQQMASQARAERAQAGAAQASQSGRKVDPSPAAVAAEAEQAAPRGKTKAGPAAPAPNFFQRHKPAIIAGGVMGTGGFLAGKSRSVQGTVPGMGYNVQGEYNLPAGGQGPGYY